jgi:hypothetical protein
MLDILVDYQLLPRCLISLMIRFMMPPHKIRTITQYNRYLYPTGYLKPIYDEELYNQILEIEKHCRYIGFRLFEHSSFEEDIYICVNCLEEEERDMPNGVFCEYYHFFIVGIVVIN